ncbi:MAG: hypothetical protein JJT75_06795 [Opitutales bacterium]|nr:hypothetical protein [Opitutales bacterium]MCH8539658.1 hypothetical protein [Opitutales bacterium]
MKEKSDNNICIQFASGTDDEAIDNEKLSFTLRFRDAELDDACQEEKEGSIIPFERPGEAVAEPMFGDDLVSSVVVVSFDETMGQYDEGTKENTSDDEDHIGIRYRPNEDIDDSCFARAFPELLIFPK